MTNNGTEHLHKRSAFILCVVGAIKIHQLLIFSLGALVLFVFLRTMHKAKQSQSALCSIELHFGN